jgi:DHA2 family multidrug resistance protein-like MFS transporter
MPSTLSLIRNMFLDPKQRTTAIGIWVSGFSFGGAIGPLVGGFLLENFWWGSVFLLGVPVMAILLITGPLLLPEYRDPNPGRFDLLSAGLSLAAVLLIIYGLKQIAESGIGLVPVLSVAAGLIVGFTFVRRQRTLADPLLDLRLFRVRAFSAALVTYTLGVFIAFGAFLFIAQYLQLVLGLSPLVAGMWSLPGSLTSIVGSNLAPVLVRRYRPGIVVTAGLALAAFGSFLLTQVGTTSLELVVFGWSIISFGFGLTFTLTADMVVGTAPPERAGAASAISETGAEFGGALGIAILGSLGVAIYRGQVAAGLPQGISPEIAEAAQETLGGAVAAAAQLPDAVGAALLNVAHGAFVQGMQLSAIIATVGFVGLAILTSIMLRNVGGSEGGHAEEGETAAVSISAAPLPQPEPQAGD